MKLLADLSSPMLKETAIQTHIFTARRYASTLAQYMLSLSSSSSSCVCVCVCVCPSHPGIVLQEGLAVASIARDVPSTLPCDDPSPLPGMHRDHNAR